MNYPPPGQHMAPPFRPQAHRQRSDYQHPSPGFYPPQPHYPYPPYQQPPHYPIPPHPGYPPPWYQPYPMQYAPQPPPRFYQPPPQSPHMPIPPRPYPMAQSGPPPFQTPQPTQTPQPEISTPSTTSQAVTSPSTTPTPASVNNSTPPAPTPKQSSATLVVASSTPSTAARSTTPVQATSPQQPALSPTRVPFYPSLPWTSVPSLDFPSASRRRRRKQQVPLSSQEVQLPLRQQSKPGPIEATVADDRAPTQEPEVPGDDQVEVETRHEASSNPPTPAPAPETDKPAPAPMPTSAVTTSPAPPTTTKPSQGHHRRSTTKPVVPIVPILPKAKQPQAVPKTATPMATPASTTINANDTDPTSSHEVRSGEDGSKTEADQVSSPTSPPPAAAPVKAVPKSWAELFARKQAGSGAGSAPQGTATPVANGSPVIPKTGSLGDVLQAYSVSGDNKVPFLEPRGLMNTGNMCYMNSILQVLVFCVPFYDFLDQIAKRVAHSFKSDTLLIEAMIMFMREYKVIDAAPSLDQLRMRLKDTELEQYGESFVPEYVYDVIRKLPRFSTMRRGHQQDAEEFLGFLLEGLHDECVHIMKSTADSASSTPSADGVASPVSERSSMANGATDSGWLEVGPKQKASVTQSSGAIATESPVTKIFGGKLRSVLRVPGLKDSVTLEPYQPLQLDIGGANVNNITDALKGLTHSETLHGAFSSPRGAGTTATKQVFIETLPPVLILHLKRFQYDNAGGTQKIWRKVGYPLDLELPKEVFPQHQRANLQMRPGGLPKYRLISVVYHHGKSASGGHYTVDVRRQEGREWIRIDDTVIRRIRADDVAHEGSEEDPKILAKALEQHKHDSEEAKSNANVYSQAFGGDDDDANEEGADKGGWSHVNGATPTTTSKTDKKWSAVANTNGTTGASTPNTNNTGRSTPKASSKYSVKDNKIAYILFYQRL